MIFFCIWPWHLNFDMTVQNVRGGLALALTRSEHSENGWKLKCWPTCGGILLLANGLENLSIPCWKYPWQSSSKHHRKGYTVKQKRGVHVLNQKFLIKIAGINFFLSSVPNFLFLHANNIPGIWKWTLRVSSRVFTLHQKNHHLA